MTGVEEGKGGGGDNDVSATDKVVQQNGAPEKAPVVTGTNMETLPRPGKQVSLTLSYIHIHIYVYLNTQHYTFLHCRKKKIIIISMINMFITRYTDDVIEIFEFKNILMIPSC